MRKCSVVVEEAGRNQDTELKVFATFQDEVRQGILLCHPIPAGIASAALKLLSMAPGVPLRTLAAFHLAIAREIKAELLATADRVMIQDATALGIGVVRLDDASPKRARRRSAKRCAQQVGRARVVAGQVVFYDLA